jgi:hypothetical protein
VILLARMEGEMRLIALTARLDGRPVAEFSWEGDDEGEQRSDRGWVALGTAERLVSHVYITAATIQASSANRGEFFNDLLNRPPWKEHRRLRRVHRPTGRPVSRRHAPIRPPSVQNLLACRSLGLSLRAGRSDGGHLSSSASAPCCSPTISSLIG